MTKLLALSHSWEIQRGDGGKRPAEWISHCLKEKFNERSKMMLGKELERGHTSRCFALTRSGRSCAPCPHPKQSFTGVAQFVLAALGEQRHREIQTDSSQVTLRSLKLKQ